MLQYLVAITYGPAKFTRNKLPVSFPKGKNSPRGFRCLLANFENPTEKKAQPRFPVPAFTYSLQMVVIVLAVSRPKGK